jgi:hypothetical protein
LLEGPGAIEALIAAGASGGVGLSVGAVAGLREELEEMRTRLSGLEEKFEAFRNQFE